MTQFVSLPVVLSVTDDDCDRIYVSVTVSDVVREAVCDVICDAVGDDLRDDLRGGVCDDARNSVCDGDILGSWCWRR